jgi:hypothetical protein
MARGDLSNAAEATSRGFDVRLQHRIDPFTGTKFGVPDNRGADTGAGLASLRFRCDGRNEFRLANGAHLLGSGRSIGPEALEEHGGNDIVASGHIGQQLVQVVLAARSIPQVMMRVYDGQIRIQDVLVQLA